MNDTSKPGGSEAWTPIATKNRPGEWGIAALFAAASCGFVMAYHDWWRAKPYSIVTLNEAFAHTAFYALALAFAFGPLYRFGLVPARAVAIRRPFGVVSVLCAVAHVLLSLGPLWPKFGWAHYAVKHGDHTALGAVSLALALWLLANSFRRAPERLGAVLWMRIQRTGLALLPLVLWHFMALGKYSKWVDWFAGRDINPAPPGTIIIFGVGAVVIALRIADVVRHRG